MPLPSNYVTNRGVVVGGGKRVILPAALIYESFVDLAAADDDGISVSHAGAGTAGTTNQTIGGALATNGVAKLTPARNVVITVTHASSVVAMSGTITGTYRGRTVTEAWSVTATGTSKTFTGAQPFDTVTSITETVAADASANTIISGTGKAIGLSAKASVASLVKETASGSVVTNGTLAKATTTHDGTYSPNGTPDGSADFEIWYISNDPENSMVG